MCRLRERARQDPEGQDPIIGFTARRNPATDMTSSRPAKYINITSTPVYDKSIAL